MARTSRRLLVPEVVQTSAMDCGPACLKAVLEGFGIGASYGRLRELCQTDVDGTSISAVAEILEHAGLGAEEEMVPLDHLARELPAVVVVTAPNGLAHFVVAWRRHGPLLQIMDPAVGRRWVGCERFLAEVHVHAQEVPADAWRSWACSDGFLRVLRSRLRSLGVRGDEEIRTAIADPGWRSIAALDAATRMVESLAASGGLASPDRLLRAAFVAARERDDAIGESFWQARAAADGQVLFRGAVLVRLAEDVPVKATPTPAPGLRPTLGERPARPGLALLGLLRADGALAPVALLLAVLFAALGAAIEALLFRGLLEVGHDLSVARQRAVAMGVFLLLLGALLALEFPALTASLRMGRHLEARLRALWLEKIPRVGDAYFRSRPVSDMAERSQNAHQIRQLPELARQFLRSGVEIAITAGAIAWLDPPTAPLAGFAAAAAFAVPLVLQQPLMERDLRARVHLGALCRFNLDALLGLVPIRAHRAERSLRREHEGLLTRWALARRETLRVVVCTDALQLVLGLAPAGWLLFTHVGRGGDTGWVLLLTYWVLLLPSLGQELGAIVRQYPHFRNLTLRVLEPLGVVDAEPTAPHKAPAAGASAKAMEVRFEGVSIRATGHTLLEGIDLSIAPGEHVAVLGPSGAGKSTLLGALLGWHVPSQGRITIDGLLLDPTRLQRLRRESAWIDPSVRVWNRSLLENLRYGAPDDAPLERALADADLLGVLEDLPAGLQTALGEAGRLLSGGEGQRVRLGRGMARGDARLVLLDEPFRGLDRDLRRDLLARARALWKDATLLCVLHDVRDAFAFDRAVVLNRGGIVESGAPEALASQAGSLLGALLAAEDALAGAYRGWRRLHLSGGRLREESDP